MLYGIVENGMEPIVFVERDYMLSKVLPAKACHWDKHLRISDLDCCDEPG